jgi:hypothetical protein
VSNLFAFCIALYTFIENTFSSHHASMIFLYVDCRAQKNIHRGAITLMKFAARKKIGNEAENKR